MKYSLLKNVILRFAIQFVCLSILFYYSAYFYMGITAPGNLYSSFLDKYFNIFNWYRYSLLSSAKLLTQLLGYNTFIVDKFHLRLVGGRGIQLVYSCLGTAVIGVWFAFVISYPFNKTIRKIKWLFIGFGAISFLNIIRIAALLIVAVKTNLNFINHHAYFNIAVYLAILVMILFYTKEKKNNDHKIPD